MNDINWWAVLACIAAAIVVIVCVIIGLNIIISIVYHFWKIILIVFVVFLIGSSISNYISKRNKRD